MGLHSSEYIAFIARKHTDSADSERKESYLPRSEYIIPDGWALHDRERVSLVGFSQHGKHCFGIIGRRASVQACHRGSQDLLANSKLDLGGLVGTFWFNRIRTGFCTGNIGPYIIDDHQKPMRDSCWEWLALVQIHGCNAHFTQALALFRGVKVECSDGDIDCLVNNAVSIHPYQHLFSLLPSSIGHLLLYNLVFAHYSYRKTRWLPTHRHEHSFISPRIWFGGG